MLPLLFQHMSECTLLSGALNAQCAAHFPSFLSCLSCLALHGARIPLTTIVSALCCILCSAWSAKHKYAPQPHTLETSHNKPSGTYDTAPHALCLLQVGGWGGIQGMVEGGIRPASDVFSLACVAYEVRGGEQVRGYEVQGGEQVRGCEVQG